MRIALFVPQLGVSGGLGVYCRSLLAGLLCADAGQRAEQPDEYEVLAPSEPQRIFPYSGLDESWRALVADPRVHCSWLDWPADFLLSMPLDAILAGPLAVVSPDLLHCTYYTGMERPGCPQVLTFHDAGFLEFPQLFGETGRQRRATLARIDGAVSKIVCTTADALGRVSRLLPFDRGRMAIVPLALSDSAEALAQARRAEARSVPLWPDGDTVADWGAYLFLPVGAGTGFNRPRKNVPTAVAAFRLKRPAGTRLIIASTGILHPKLLAEILPADEIEAGRHVGAAWHSGDDAIRVLPDLERDRFLAAMAHARAIVYPSRYEGFGLPSIEAMALEVPLIAGRATSIPEIVGDAGILVDPDDVAGFGEAFQRVLNDRELAATLVAKGRQRVQGFTIANMGRGIRDVYRGIVGSKR